MTMEQRVKLSQKGEKAPEEDLGKQKKGEEEGRGHTANLKRKGS